MKARIQEQVTIYLSNPEWGPLPEMLRERLEYLDPERDVVFLIRAAMSPAIFLTKIPERYISSTASTSPVMHL